MKKILSRILFAFSFVFFVSNVYASETTCTYSMSNVDSNYVKFNTDRTVTIADKSDTLLGDTKDHNLVLKVKDLSDGKGSKTSEYISLTLDDDKFSFADSYIFDFDLFSKPSDLSQYISELKKCPELGIMYYSKGEGKYAIADVTVKTDGSKLKDMVGRYDMGSMLCTKESKVKQLVCLYQTDDQMANVAIEIYTGKVSESNYKRLQSVRVDSVKDKYKYNSQKNNIRIGDFQCNGNQEFRCNSFIYYGTNITYDGGGQNEIWINSYDVEGQNSSQMSNIKTYQLPNTLYFAKIKLYDEATNSGPSGNPNKSGTKAYCVLHPETEVCKQKYNPDVSKAFHFCEEEGVLKTLRIVHTLLVIAKIIVPLILIILGSIDYGKAAMAGDADLLEKTTAKLIKKLIVGIMIFLIPTIVDGIISFSQSDKDAADAKTGEFKKCALCFAGDKMCDTYINSSSK